MRTGLPILSTSKKHPNFSLRSEPGRHPNPDLFSAKHRAHGSDLPRLAGLVWCRGEISVASPSDRNSCRKPSVRYVRQLAPIVPHKSEPRSSAVLQLMASIGNALLGFRKKSRFLNSSAGQKIQEKRIDIRADRKVRSGTTD